MDEAQLSALINAAVREAVERTTQELTAKFETVTAGLRKNRDDLLAEKKGGESKSALENFDEWLAGTEERLRQSNERVDRLLGKTAQPAFVPKQTEVTITRDEARSGSAYRAAKAEAEAKGLPLRIVDERASAPVAGSRVKYVSDDASRTVYANKEVIREAGGLQRLKETAERDGKRVVVFRSVDDLPSHLHRAHAETLAANKPDTLLGGGE
jgi:hypothetical protein